MESFTISIQYTPEDLQKAYKVHYSKVYPIAGRLLLILGIISLVFGAALLLYSYLGFSFTNWFAWFLIVYGLIIMAIYFWRVGTIGRRMFSKMPDFEYPYEYVFSDQGIKITSKNVNSENNWDYFSRYCITEDMILLYPNKFRFNFFARKYFTEEQFLQLRSWVTEKVPPAFKKKMK
jgi:hypothetical protein